MTPSYTHGHEIGYAVDRIFSVYSTIYKYTDLSESTLTRTPTHTHTHTCTQTWTHTQEHKAIFM